MYIWNKKQANKQINQADIYQYVDNGELQCYQFDTMKSKTGIIRKQGEPPWLRRMVPIIWWEATLGEKADVRTF